MSFSRALVTGATGFLGTHLSAHLENQERQVTRLSRERADVRDARALEAVFGNARPEVVFHLAGGRSNDARACLETNLFGTLNVLEAARGCGARRVIVAGSAAEYGETPGPWHEASATRPRSFYGISRLAATQSALLLAGETLSVCVLRLATVYGPSQPRTMFVAEAIEAAARGQVFAPQIPSHRQDLVWVDDVVAALVRAAEGDFGGAQLFNIGGANAPTLGEINDLIGALHRGEAPGVLSPIPAHAPVLEIVRAHEELGWTPQTALAAGLRAMLEAAKMECELCER